MEVIYHSNLIWTIPDFLSKRECEDLILFCEQKGFEEATVSLSNGPKMIKGLRNNFRVIHEDIQLANEYWERLKKYCPKKIDDYIAIGLNEKFRFYRYEPSQRFKKHMDGRFKRGGDEESRITFMVYLNDDYTGGCTKFSEIEITPKQGMALCFIHEQKHEGSVIQDGVKYVIRSDIMFKQLC